MTLPVGTSAPGYVAGHVFFDGMLFARPFDEQRLDFTDSAKLLATHAPS